MRFTSFLLACGVACGCSSEPKAHPPLVGGNCTTNCGTGSPIGTGNPNGGSGGRTSDADGSTGSATVNGTVAVFKDLLFETVTPFADEGTIALHGPHDATAKLSGANFFVENADFSKPLWAYVTATTGADLMPTITAVDGTAASVEVAFGKVSVLTAILTTVTPTPPALIAPGRDPQAAQIVVRFVDDAGKPVSGVQLTQQTGVLYDAGPSSYSDAFGVTQARGIAVFTNAPASGAFPTATLLLAYKAPTVSKAVSFTVLVAKGALTLVTVGVES